MIVTIANGTRTLSVIWRYDDVQTGKKGFEGKVVKRSKCLVRAGIGTDKPIIATGVAIQSPLDRECKGCGRKLSLERAIKELNISKTERAIFWLAFKAMRNGKW